MKDWFSLLMIKFPILIICSVIGLSTSTRGVAQDHYSTGDDNQLHRAKTDEQSNGILLEGDPKSNASTDSPYYYTYQYFSPDDFMPTLRTGLQSIGISFKPTEDSQRRDVEKCERREGELEWSVFWTDWVIINQNLLVSLEIDKREFEVELVAPHEYRIQMYGCYRGGTQTEYRPLPNEPCRFGHLPRSAGPNAEAVIKVDVQHRGSGGTWRDFDNQEFDTQPITVSVNNAIQKILESTESEPRIVLGEPGCI